MPDPSSKPDRLKPAMPAIPGVPAPEQVAEAEKKKQQAGPPLWTNRTVQIGAAAAFGFVSLLAFVLPQFLREEPPPAPIVLDNSTAPNGSSPSPGGATPESEQPVAPGPVASPQDLAKPWSFVKFKMRLATGDQAPAMVIRLPSGTGADAYWGFLTVAPYGRCEMELEQDLAKIAADYGYRARHPMVVDSCTQSVYDPLSYGGTHGVWVRGQVVKGAGLRPPLAIEIVIEKGSVVATRSE